MKPSELLEKFGSPLYAYDAPVIRARCAALKHAFPGFTLYYACKANTNPAIVALIYKEGFGIECVSPGEIAAARNAGVPIDAIAYTCGSIAEKELVEVVSSRARVHLDSLTQVEYFGKNFPAREISVRLNLGVGAGHHEHVITGGPDSKFGIDAANIEGLKSLAEIYKLRITGLHQHIGSNILDVDIFMEAMNVLFDAATRIPELEHLDFGGGLGIPYDPGETRLAIEKLAAAVAERVKRFEAETGRKLRYSFEPGRYLVAESGTLYVTVVDIKKNAEKIFIGVDSGMGHLIRPAMYGSHHAIENVSHPEAKRETVTIAGYYCESGDILAKDRELAMPELGDILAIRNAGAYGYAMASDYNLRPKPAEVLIDGETVSLVRERSA